VFGNSQQTGCARGLSWHSDLAAWPRRRVVVFPEREPFTAVLRNGQLITDSPRLLAEDARNHARRMPVTHRAADATART
jgi:hypothetical protein